VPCPDIWVSVQERYVHTEPVPSILLCMGLFFKKLDDTHSRRSARRSVERKSSRPLMLYKTRRVSFAVRTPSFS
jgi:hypothetical protein